MISVMYGKEGEVGKLPTEEIKKVNSSERTEGAVKTTKTAKKKTTSAVKEAEANG